MANPPPRGRTTPKAPTQHDAAPAEGRPISLDEDEDGETPLRAASASPGPTPAVQRANTLRKHSDRVVEPQDRLRSDPEGRKAAARRKRAAAIQHNPFLDDDEPAMPRLPADDEEWAYAWKRHMIEGKDDRQNMQRSLAGKLPWQYFTVEDIPHEDRVRLESLMQTEGRFSGNIVYNDLVAMRTSRFLRDQLREAQDIRATRQIQATRQQFTDARRAEELGTWIEDDRETAVEVITL